MGGAHDESEFGIQDHNKEAGLQCNGYVEGERVNDEKWARMYALCNRRSCDRDQHLYAKGVCCRTVVILNPLSAERWHGVQYSIHDGVVTCIKRRMRFWDCPVPGIVGVAAD